MSTIDDVCVTKVQYGNRTFSHKDVLRIYCNNLTELEQALVDRGLKESPCEEGYTPCSAMVEISEALITDLMDSNMEQAFLETLLQMYLYTPVLDTIGTVQNTVESFFFEMAGRFKAYPDETVAAHWDDLLVSDIPNPIDRRVVVDKMMIDMTAGLADIEVGFVEESSDMFQQLKTVTDLSKDMMYLVKVLELVMQREVLVEEAVKMLVEVKEVFKEC